MDTTLFIKGVNLMALSAMHFDHFEKVFVATVSDTGECYTFVYDEGGGLTFRARHDSSPFNSLRPCFFACLRCFHVGF